MPQAEVHTSYTHLIEGDLAPVGRVHLVRLGPDVGDERERHILTQMDADSNMGARHLEQRSRRGPFKRQPYGRSRVMDASAHVKYRRRGRAFEITVKRGITDYELDTLIAKLSAHRLATHGSFLFLIKGGSKKKLGNIDRINMEKLRRKIDDCLSKYKVIGLLLQDTAEPGVLHRGYSHSATSKEAYRNLLESRTFGIN